MSDYKYSPHERKNCSRCGHRCHTDADYCVPCGHYPCGSAVDRSYVHPAGRPAQPDGPDCPHFGTTAWGSSLEVNGLIMGMCRECWNAVGIQFADIQCDERDHENRRSELAAAIRALPVAPDTNVGTRQAWLRENAARVVEGLDPLPYTAPLKPQAQPEPGARGFHEWHAFHCRTVVGGAGPCDGNHRWLSGPFVGRTCAEVYKSERGPEPRGEGKDGKAEATEEARAGAVSQVRPGVVPDAEWVPASPSVRIGVVHRASTGEAAAGQSVTPPVPEKSAGAGEKLGRELCDALVAARAAEAERLLVEAEQMLGMVYGAGAVDGLRLTLYSILRWARTVRP